MKTLKEGQLSFAEIVSSKIDEGRGKGDVYKFDDQVGTAFHQMDNASVKKVIDTKVANMGKGAAEKYKAAINNIRTSGVIGREGRGDIRKAVKTGITGDALNKIIDKAVQKESIKINKQIEKKTGEAKAKLEVKRDARNDLIAGAGVDYSSIEGYAKHEAEKAGTAVVDAVNRLTEATSAIKSSSSSSNFSPSDGHGQTASLNDRNQVPDIGTSRR